MTRKAPEAMSDTSTFTLTPPAGEDTPETQAVIKRVMENHHARLKAREQHATQTQALFEKWKKEHLSALGEQNWKKLNEFSKKHRQSNSDKDSESHAERHRLAREESLKLMKQSGVDPEKMKTIQAQFAPEIARLAKSRLPERRGLRFIDEDVAPASEPTTTPYVQKPPYQSVTPYVYEYIYPANGKYTYKSIYNDPATGDVGHKETYQNYEAGDFDWFDFWVISSVGFWYKPTITGRLQVKIKANCTAAQYNVNLIDDWGWSEAGIWMESDVIANITSNKEDAATTPCWPQSFHTTSISGTYTKNVYATNAYKEWTLVTDDPVTANNSVFVQVGLDNYHGGYVNDVDTTQTMYNRWLIKELNVWELA